MASNMVSKFASKLLRMAQEYEKQRAAIDPPYVRESTAMERMFGNCAPAIVAFKIDNGYVVRTVNIGDVYEPAAVAGGGFTYCKDHQAIADHIVSEAAREKLMPKQHPLAYGSPHANQVTTSKLTVR